MSADIRKKNLTEMLHLTYKEMKRIKGLKCPADVEMVKRHSDTLDNLRDRTARIEAAGYTTLALLGLLVGFLALDYFKAKKTHESENKSVEIAHNANR